MIRVTAVALVLLEIAGFVILGQRIGVWGVLGLVLLGAGMGILLLRAGGGAALIEVRRAMAQGRDPGPAIARGGFRMLAGLLLLLPGFFSDLAAIALLLPPVQRGVLRALTAGGIVRAAGRPADRADRPASRASFRAGIPEADWEEIPPPKRPTHRPSGWTRH